MRLRVKVARLPVPRGAALAAVLALAALVRLVSYAQVRDGSILDFRLAADDMGFYDAWARQIAEGDLLSAPRPYDAWHDAVAREAHELTSPGQPFDDSTGRATWDRWTGPRTFYQDPLYAYALAGSYRLFGPRLGPVLVWQALLGLGMVALVFLVARTLWDETAALAAGVLAALYAPFVFYECTLLRGTLQAFLTMAAIALATTGGRRASVPSWMGAGVAAGLGFLAHGAGLLLALALPVAVRDRRRAACLAGYAAGLALALFPLLARNAAVGLPPWTTGTAAARGAHDFVVGHAADADPAHGFPFSAAEGRIFARTDGRLLPTMKEALATHRGPMSWLKLMGAKLLAFFDGWEAAEGVNFYYFLLQSPVLAAIGLRLGLLLPLAALGFALAVQADRIVRRERVASPPALAVACGLVAALVFFTSSRVRLGTAAAMMPFAGAGLVEAARRARGGQWRSLAGPATAAIVAAVAAAAPWWPRPALVRDRDYRVGNVLAIAHWQHERQQGHPERGLRLLVAQLATEPRELRGLAPERVGSVPGWAAGAASSFSELHRAISAAHVEAGRPQHAAAHAEQARLLSIVARQRLAAGGG